MEDEFFKEFIRAFATEPRCSYCDSGDGRTPIAAPFDELFERIYEGVTSEYNDAADEPVPYESAEGGYQLPTMGNHELLFEVGFYAGNDDLHDRIAQALPAHAWIRRNPLSLSEEDRLIIGWEGFSKLVKHRVRYLMFPENAATESEAVAPTEIIDALGNLVREQGLVTTIPKGTLLYRVRVHEPGLILTTTAELGAPPGEAARFSNRMSPAGVSLFYAGLDEGTAIAETYIRRDGKPAETTIATFEVTEDLRVLNLVNLPKIPSIFANVEETWTRPALIFLHGFVADFTEPIDKDGREHVEYVPSQIVTEYFRYRFRDGDGRPVHGILYPSSRVADGKACVLFASHEDFTDDWTFGKPSAVPVKLLTDRIRRVAADTTPTDEEE